MSTEHCKLIDCKDEKYSIVFETSGSGNKFMFTEEGENKVLKIWFTKRDWEAFKETVDLYILE